MRAPILLISPLICAAAGYGQSGIVRNAATAGVRFTGPTVLAPDSRAVISYSRTESAPPHVSATVSLRPAGAATAIPAQVLIADGSTINFIVPSTAPIGPAQLIYQATGDTTKWIEVAVAPSAFQLFINPTTDAPIAQFAPATGSARPLALATPVQPGQAAVIWGSGAPMTTSIPAITLGGVPQQVLFAGNPVQMLGIEQINFRVAPNTPLGCYVPLTVSWGADTFTSFLSTSTDGTACQHPFRLSAKDLATLDSGGSVNVATVTFSSNFTAAAADHDSRQEQISANFIGWSGSFLASRFNATAAAGCTVSTPAASLISLVVPGFPSNLIGDITLRQGSSQVVLSAANNFTQELPAISSGPWTLSTRASTLNFTITPPVMLSAATTPVPLSRATDQTISWNGSDLDPNSGAILNLTSPNQPTLTCNAPAAAGSVVIPKELLTRIAPGAATLRLLISQPIENSPNVLNGDSVVVVSQTSTDTRPVVLQ